ncbi:hypothetical protein GRF29_19g115460 [Pseudopithomyces chartarum]|uniref:Uncharacterized protein n=1 Tax=Pseudopithomyces chartarum TaxID=1892770 RepID=A0AAN6M133_9PLEO|nr:hypothetical protein GRF29_19g115460 [Pseudopithomyces chartarum]
MAPSNPALDFFAIEAWATASIPSFPPLQTKLNEIMTPSSLPPATTPKATATAPAPCPTSRTGSPPTNRTATPSASKPTCV